MSDILVWFGFGCKNMVFGRITPNTPLLIAIQRIASVFRDHHIISAESLPGEKGYTDLNEDRIRYIAIKAPVFFNASVMALKIIDHGSTEYQQMVQLRSEVLRKPLGMAFTPEELEKERENILIGAFEDDKMLGCCMLIRESDEEIRLRQMAVLYKLQGKGIGRALMQFAENIARDIGHKKITMHARKLSVPFFEKLGYTVCSDEFTEISIPHFEMEKKLQP
jgi:predicted GNAT family N-acyltransferase